MIYCFILSLPLSVMFPVVLLRARSKVAADFRREELRSQGIQSWQQCWAKEFCFVQQAAARLTNLALTSHMQVFLDEKDIVGRNGFAVDDRLKSNCRSSLFTFINRPGDYYPGFPYYLVSLRPTWPIYATRRSVTYQPVPVPSRRLWRRVPSYSRLGSCNTRRPW